MKFKKILLLFLVLTMSLLAACSSNKSNDDEEELSVADIESIQAHTDQIYYGEGLVSVDVTYKDGVDVSDVTAASYILEDRGSETPDFRTLEITDVVINGQIVTLNMNLDTGATEDNVLIYTGSNDEGDRLKIAPSSMYVAEGWYRGSDGTIYYGDEDTDEYSANTTGLGYYTRESLELRLRHTGEAEEDAACLANEYGEYNSEGLWQETEDANVNENGFVSFSDLGIYVPSTSANSADGDADPYVRGWAYIPENYNANGSVPLIINIAGNGTSFWLLPDGTNNFGTGLLYDGAGLKWKDSGAIVLNIHDRSNLGGGGDDYDFVVDDVNTIKYFLDNYDIDPGQITLTGNSRGTVACDQIIRALAGLGYSSNQDLASSEATNFSKFLNTAAYGFTIKTFVCNNGAMLKNIFGAWTDADVALPAIAATGLRVWANDGEQDTNNIEAFKAFQEVYRDLDADENWIADNLHISGYPSDIFYYWGVSDHNMTRTLYYYFYDTPYYGPKLQVVDGEISYTEQLEPGDTYTLQFRGNQPDDPDYAYQVYSETIKDWVLSAE